MTSPDTSPAFSDLMSKIGYFLLYWSSFEQSLADAIVRMRQRLPQAPEELRGGLKDRLDLWLSLTVQGSEHVELARAMRDQALALREVRNLIVHGLIGGDAHPGDGSPAHIVCAAGGFEAPGREIVRYSLEDLERFIQGADACRRACIDVQSFNFQI